ncbi:hypothetical protein ACFE04_000875 [Oxalis oulophora]
MGFEQVHVLMVTLALQGHINPMLRFARTLISKGISVTLATTENARDRLLSSDAYTTNTTPEIQFEFFSDGFSHEFDRDGNLGPWIDSLVTVGSKNLSNLITDLNNGGKNFSCVITSPFLPWVIDVASKKKIPVAVLWIQACAVFSIYYQYINHANSFPSFNNLNQIVQFPGLPLLKVRDIPTFILPSTIIQLRDCVKSLILGLDKVKWVLANSFHELEEDIVESISCFKPIWPVGPLVSPFMVGKQENVIGNVDLWKAEDSCTQWLDKKKPNSVIYVSFGSITMLSQKQMDNVATALKNSNLPFLWVVKTMPNDHSNTNWSDQPLDAKLMVDVFKVGVRIQTEEDGSVVAEEVERMRSQEVHVLMITLALQGHINPMLRLAKILSSKGIHVTLVTTENARERLLNSKISAPTSINIPKIHFEFFSDGFSLDFDRDNNVGPWMDSLLTVGSMNLYNLITNLNKVENFSCIITGAYSIPSVTNFASENQIPIALMWITSCAFFSVCYQYVNHADKLSLFNDSNQTVEFFGLPSLEVRDLPTFILPSTISQLKDCISTVFEGLDKVKWVLVNSFYELEEDVVNSISCFKPILPIGPLISPRMVGKQENVIGKFDMWKAEDSCLQWLDKQKPLSVIYVSFGSIATLSQNQMDNNPLNAKRLADVFKIGVRIQTEKDGSITAKEVQRCIFEVTVGPEAEKMRKRATKLKEAIKKGLHEVTLALQSHINPILKFAKILTSKGVRVTIATTENVQEQLLSSKISTTTTKSTPNIHFEFFSDGLSHDFDRYNNLGMWMDSLVNVGSKNLSNLIIDLNINDGIIKFSCVITSPYFIPWVTKVESNIEIPVAVLWTQACAVFSLYYQFINHADLFSLFHDLNQTVHFFGLPLLKVSDIPTFLLPSTISQMRDCVWNMILSLDKVKWILVNSFHELEEDIVNSMSSFKPIWLIGPLISPFMVGKKENDIENVNLWKSEDSCLEWLDKKKPCSVIYISFGSMIILSQKQMDNVATALKNSNLPFLWVVRTTHDDSNINVGKLSTKFLHETKDIGLVVSWCPQEKVLMHEAVACFMTHCGWSSTLETLAAGIPVIGYPQSSDQPMNAKLLVDVYKIGVRIRTEDDGSITA